MSDSGPRLAWDAWVRRTLAIFLVSTALVAGGAWPLVRGYDAGRIELAATQERGKLDVAVLDIEAALLEVIGDLRVASNLPATRNYLADPSADHADTMAAAFQAIMSAYGRYDQIRLLDMTGRELVRVRSVGERAVVAPPDALENRGTRPYFKEAATLPSGGIYLSPIDLRVYRASGGGSSKPVFRVATPVIDAAGAHKALAILNVDAVTFLRRFAQSLPADPTRRAMLFDRNGDYLADSGEPNGWAFLPDRPGFAQADRGAWRRIVAERAGTLRTSSGLFLFATVRAGGSIASRELRVGDGEGQPISDPRDYFKAVTLLPNSTLDALRLSSQPLARATAAVVATLLLLLSGLSAWFWLYRKRALEVERVAAQEIADLYERAPCGYHSLDENGVVRRMNETELRWLGYRREDVVDRLKAADLLSESSRRDFLDKFPRLMQTGSLHDVDIELVRKDGSLLPATLNATVLRDESGNFWRSRSTVTDATERRRLEAELVRRATIDPLTGIANRRHFFELAEREVSRSARGGTPLAVLLLDIDEFKKVNDRFGHDTGDAVLRFVSTACHSVLRDIDVFGRLGGEEFAILLPDADAEKGRLVAERVRECVEHARAPVAGGEPHAVTVSIGVASIRNDEPGNELAAMLRRADVALYRAKDSGRNRVCVAPS